MPEYEFPGFGDLPFHDPIARTIRWQDRDVVLKVLGWRDDERVERALKKIARENRKHGWYEDA